MRDYLLDIVDHVLPLGDIELLKVVGDAKSTVVRSYNESIMFSGTFVKPLADFEGEFGMTNLPKLETLLKIPEYKEDAVLEVKRETKDGQKIPAGIHFENKNGDFQNDYRFASAAVANAKIKTIVAKSVFTWPIEFAPTVASIQKFKYQDSVSDGSNVFSVKTEKNNLIFFFGDAGGHAGSFVFQNNITGVLKDSKSWSTKLMLTVLNLNGDKIFKISDQGTIIVNVSTGLINYEYTIPYVTK